MLEHSLNAEFSTDSTSGICIRESFLHLPKQLMPIVNVFGRFSISKTEQSPNEEVPNFVTFNKVTSSKNLHS
jgi:hypothetical protein